MKGFGDIMMEIRKDIVRAIIVYSLRIKVQYLQIIRRLYSFYILFKISKISIRRSIENIRA